VDTERLVAEIDAELRSHGTPERAEKEKAYLKSDLTFYGTSVPAIRSVVKATAKAHKDWGHDDVVHVTQTLWAAAIHERRMATVELLTIFSDRLDAADMRFLERLLRESKTWALVDGLSVSVLGPVVAKDPDAADVLDHWATDDDFWVRRAALLALLIPLRKGGGDFERFCRYADAMLDEKEFFIRKAIGWVLRDTARKRPDMVYEWLLPRAERASTVTLREAVKPLSDEQRAAVTSGRSGRCS
jgi:3-methyladenine DNA glycosylase AlkD